RDAHRHLDPDRERAGEEALRRVAGGEEEGGEDRDPPSRFEGPAADGGAHARALEALTRGRIRSCAIARTALIFELIAERCRSTIIRRVVAPGPRPRAAQDAPWSAD